jgi:hypothetical protein
VPSLRETQTAFLSALHGSASDIDRWVIDNGLAADRRIAVYRNNVREGFLSAMRAAYPVVAQLAGDDWFAQRAHAYREDFPSRSGNLHYAGKDFPGFLSEQLRSGPYEYFADVARLEWAYQEVLVAAEHDPLDIAALGNVAPEDYASLIFATHPAARVVASDYPVLAIWKAHQPTSPASSQPLRLDSGPSRVLLIRRDDHVEMRELCAADCALLQTLMSRATLGDAVDAAVAVDAATNVAACLSRIVSLGTLGKFHLEESIPT